jgi:hypothetical protein
MVADHAEPAKRFRQDNPLTLALGGLDGRRVTLHGFRHAAGALVRPGIL